MSLVVEDGTGKTDSQTFATVDYLKSFAKARGLTVPSGNADCEILLTKGMDAMRGLDYKGTRYSRDQAQDFPRVGVVIDGYTYNSTELPPTLIDLQCVYSLAAQRVDLQPVVATGATGEKIEQTVGDITTRWAETGRANNRPVVEAAKPYLKKLLRIGGDQIAIVRA